MQSRFSWLPLASGLTVLVLSLALAVLVVTGKTPTNQNIRSQAAVVAGSLGLSPATGDYAFSPGSAYPVGIVVDSKTASADGVDVIIKFDPKKVQVVGSSLSPTTLFEKVPLNAVDNAAGTIRFSALTFSPKPVTGILATFSFRPLASGEVGFVFDFTPGATVDSNIAEHGTAKDVLGSVENATYNFR